MMTGVLLFPVRPAGMGDFYRKRIGRIVVPLLFLVGGPSAAVLLSSELCRDDR